MFFENRAENIYITEITSFFFPMHMHHNIELTMCTEGTLQAVCNNQTRLLRPGDAMLAFPNDIHSYVKTDYGKGIMLIFNPNISEIIKNETSGRVCGGFASDAALIPLFLELYDEFMSNSSSYLIMYGYLHIISGTLMKLLPPYEGCHRLEPDTFSKALQYISSNYTKPLTLKTLEKYLGVSGYHISRIFSEKVPGGFCRYIQILRVEYAKELLEHTDMNIYEILLEAGFSNQRTFNRVFKDITGLTPRDYKALKQQKMDM